MDIWPIVTAAQVDRRRTPPVDAATLASAAALVERVATQGRSAVVDLALRFGDLRSGDPLWIDRDGLQAAWNRLPADVQALLTRTADRIRAFARAQRATATPTTLNQGDLRMGQEWAPVARAGCYAPGGRYPLPSSVLMTAVTARVAGVAEVVVASPRPDDVTLGAAFLAGADGLLAVGGAQAVAAMAYGIEGLAPVDVIVGPGNRWVTAAKQLVNGMVGIDMLAGPSELLVVADETADPALIAADLLAQAEHDADARPLVVSTSESLLASVREALLDQLRELPTADVAAQALTRGFGVCCPDPQTCAQVANVLAPEHLQLLVAAPDAWRPLLTSWGGLFVGEGAAEVLGDYGAGPNHVLPTGGTARYSGGLSVFTFLRARTWMQLRDRDGAGTIAEDARALARLEGLEGHARAAGLRTGKPLASAS